MKARKLEVVERFEQCSYPAAELEDIGFKGYRQRRSESNGKNPDFCMRHAMFEVDGKRLCPQHAGIAALEYLL
jgi:hypothetical protein